MTKVTFCGPKLRGCVATGGWILVQSPPWRTGSESSGTAKRAPLLSHIEAYVLSQWPLCDYVQRRSVQLPGTAKRPPVFGLRVPISYGYGSNPGCVGRLGGFGAWTVQWDVRFCVARHAAKVHSCGPRPVRDQAAVLGPSRRSTRLRLGD
jgi:hypothetical protein